MSHELVNGDHSECGPDCAVTGDLCCGGHLQGLCPDCDTKPAKKTEGPVTATYRIREERLDELKATIEKLSRKSEKLGLAPISIVVGKHEDVGYSRRRDRGIIRWEKSELYPEPSFYIRFFEITLTGQTPRLAGWEFIATLQHLEVDGQTVNMLKTVPGFEGQLPKQYRNAEPTNCDHCKKSIKTRKETFIVRHEDGTWMQVGRRCTQDFLGGKDPHAVIKAMEYLQLAADACSEDSDFDGMGFGGGGPIRFDLQEFLTYVAACVRVDGWVSRGQSRATDGALKATADSASLLIDPPFFGHDERAKAEYREWAAERRPNDDDKATAEKALTYAREDLNADVGNDYLYNLWVACNQSLIDRKLTGICASLISHYLREVERQAMKTAELRRTQDSKHLGQVGERLTLNVQVARITVVGENNQYGPKLLHKMITDSGDLLVWFATGDGLEAGKEYTVKATVKKHDDYKGVKQTVVSRVSVVTPKKAKDAQ